MEKSAAVFRKSARYSLFFAPGLFFVSLGLCAIVAPHLVVAAVAALFMFIGGFFVALAWKFVQFKRKFESVARAIEAHIVIQPVNRAVADQDSRIKSANGEEFSHKKIVYH